MPQLLARSFGPHPKAFGSGHEQQKLVSCPSSEVSGSGGCQRRRAPRERRVLWMPQGRGRLRGLRINKAGALPPGVSLAKQFIEGKCRNLDIPFSCFRNLRTPNLVGFEKSMELIKGDVQRSPLSNQQVQ